MNELRKSRALNLVLAKVSKVFTEAMCKQNALQNRIAKLEHALNMYKYYSLSGVVNASHCHTCLELYHPQDLNMCNMCNKDYCERCAEGNPYPSQDSFNCTSCTTNRA